MKGIRNSKSLNGKQEVSVPMGLVLCVLPCLDKIKILYSYILVNYFYIT